MELLNFLRRESEKSLETIAFIAVVSGVANAMLLAIVNLATSDKLSHSTTAMYFLLYLVCISLFIFTKNYVLKQTSTLVEEIVKNLRIRIANKIRYSDLLHLEETGTSDIFAGISQDASQISQTVTFAGNAFQSVIMVTFTVIYIAFISLPAFFITLTSILLGVVSYLRHRKGATDLLKVASKKESEFFGALNELLLGFKELKVNQGKNNAAFENFKDIANDASDYKIKAILKLIISYIASQSFFYVLLAFIIFVLPAYADITNQHLVKVSAAILFIIGPLDSIISSLPMLFTANVSAANIKRLEDKLSSAHNTGAAVNYDRPLTEQIAFNDKIVFDGLRFEYPRKQHGNTFEIGPINLTIEKGKIIFVTGGNGSGKSTFMKLMSGLYYPNEGEITVDGELIHGGNYHNYRELFSIIFTDFYLFHKLYGLREYDQKLINSLLVEMQIDKKTQIIDGVINNIQLSTGQRKRLALVAAILDDKPIYIFDEVAADQDPEFKNYFYKTLLPNLKANGKTVIAVTHDEYYFGDSDVRYMIKNGTFVKAEHKN